MLLSTKTKWTANHGHGLPRVPRKQYSLEPNLLFCCCFLFCFLKKKKKGSRPIWKPASLEYKVNETSKDWNQTLWRKLVSFQKLLDTQQRSMGGKAQLPDMKQLAFSVFIISHNKLSSSHSDAWNHKFQWTTTIYQVKMNLHGSFHSEDGSCETNSYLRWMYVCPHPYSEGIMLWKITSDSSACAFPHIKTICTYGTAVGTCCSHSSHTIQFYHFSLYK